VPDTSGDASGTGGAIALALAALTATTIESKLSAVQTLKQNWVKTREVGTPARALPLSPGRPKNPQLISPRDLPRRRLGSEAGRVALLHAIAHIEFNAIDLATDMLARFAYDAALTDDVRDSFVDDWVHIADDEARHFKMISDRLENFDVNYGDLPAHNGLWEAALATKDTLVGRLVVAPMVLEARGLDVTPGMIDKLKSYGDDESAAIFQTIYDEEIPHVATGAKWFHFIAKNVDLAPERYFQELLGTYFKGALKPPFNEKARSLAGVPETYYRSRP